MKFSIIFFSSLLITYYLRSQDIIRLKSGDEIKAIIVNFGEKEIEYKKFEKPDGPIYAVDRILVSSVDFFKQENEKNNSQKLVNNMSDANPTGNIDSILLSKQISLQEEQNNLLKQLILNTKSKSTETVKSNDTASINQLIRQNTAINNNLEKIQQQIDKISGNVTTLTNTIASVSGGKDKIDWSDKPVGFGTDIVGLFHFGNEKSDYDKYSRSLLILSFNVAQNFRLEAEYTAEIIKVRITNYYLRESDFYFALGGYGMWQYKHTNLYAGVKFHRVTDNQATYFNPLIGGEFIFFDRFSLACEIGFPFLISESFSHRFISFNRMFLRFYL